jgi:hypothetical protein
VLFWTGNALGLVDLHQLLGILLVLGLWTMLPWPTGPGCRPPGRRGRRLGLLVLIVGLTQRDLFPGSAHWVIQVGTCCSGSA